MGFLAQDAPVYAGLSVADHLAFGAHLNPGWDAVQARDRIARHRIARDWPGTVRPGYWPTGDGFNCRTGPLARRNGAVYGYLAS